MGHVNIADVTYQKDSLLNFAGTFYKVMHRFKRIIVGFSLLVNLYSLLKIVHIFWAVEDVCTISFAEFTMLWARFDGSRPSIVPCLSLKGKAMP